MTKRCAGLILLTWVMWIRTDGISGTQWAAQTGFNTEKQCRASVAEKMDIWRQFRDAIMTKDTVVFPSTKTSVTYSCLPESYDPRR